MSLKTLRTLPIVWFCFSLHFRPTLNDYFVITWYVINYQTSAVKAISTGLPYSCFVFKIYHTHLTSNIYLTAVKYYLRTIRQFILQFFLKIKNTLNYKLETPHYKLEILHIIIALQVYKCITFAWQIHSNKLKENPILKYYKSWFQPFLTIFHFRYKLAMTNRQ